MEKPMGKWKGWTASLGVKTVSFAAILALAFSTLFYSVQLIRSGAGQVLGADALAADFGDNSYFYNYKVPRAISDANVVLFYGSERNILAGNCLQWRQVEEYDGAWQLFELSADGSERQNSWFLADISSTDSPEAAEAERQLIGDQVNRFRSAVQSLGQTDGLIYAVGSGEDAIANTSASQQRDFVNYPVFFARADDGSILTGGDNASERVYAQPIEGKKLLLGFTGDVVRTQNAAWGALQREAMIQVGLIALSVAGGAALAVVLLCGAGRRRGSSGVQFTAFDWPWLDLSLAALIFYEGAAVYFFAQAVYTLSQFQNKVPLYAVLGAGAAALLSPALWWLMSFAKSCKANNLSRRSGVCWALRALRGIGSRLWAGTPLTLQGLAIGIGLWVALMIIGAAGGGEGVVLGTLAAAGITALLLWHLRRLNLLRLSARAVSAGAAPGEIAVRGGAVGDIAAAIAGISQGINTAVAERMKSERLKTELITNVSHDIRTPLTSIITYTDLLQKEGIGSNKVPEYLQVLSQKAQRLKVLTDELFEAAKAASGSVEVNLQELNLSDLIRQVLGELSERVDQSGLDFRLNLPDSAPVCADGKMMWRVMENLLSNVFKYAMAPSRVYIDLFEAGGGWRLTVKNISACELGGDPAELTERFKRGDAARAGEGSGLGLSIVRSFMEAQGGRFALGIDGDLFKAIVWLPASTA